MTMGRDEWKDWGVKGDGGKSMVKMGCGVSVRAVGRAFQVSLKTVSSSPRSLILLCPSSSFISPPPPHSLKPSNVTQGRILIKYQKVSEKLDSFNNTFYLLSLSSHVSH